MSEIYRIPPWIMLERWELAHNPTDKPNTFTVSIFSSKGDFADPERHDGKGVSISHAAKNAFKNRLRTQNDKSIPAKGSTLPPENQAEGNQPAGVSGVDQLPTDS